MKLFGKKTSSSETPKTTKQRTILVFGSPKSGTSSLTFQFMKNRATVGEDEKQHNFSIHNTEEISSPRDPEKQKQTLETMEKLTQTQLQQMEDRTSESLNEQYEEMKTVLQKLKTEYEHEPTTELEEKIKLLESQYSKLKEDVSSTLSAKESSNPSEDVTEEDLSESSDLSNSLTVTSTLRRSSSSSSPLVSKVFKNDPKLSGSQSELPKLAHLKNRKESLIISESPMPVEDNSHVENKLKLWREGVEKFNKGFKEGMNWFFKNELIQDDPLSISKFLLSNGDLSKAEVGQYLGDKKLDPKILIVFCEYVATIVYPDLNFEECMRRFLVLFMLPQEAQQINRIMETYAEAYARLHPDRVDDHENVFLLAGSILMLNVSLHSPKIKSKDKLSLEQFQNILSATKFTKKYTEQIYESFKEKEMTYDTIGSINNNEPERKKSKSKSSKKDLKSELNAPINSSQNSYLLNVKNIEENKIQKIEIKDLASQIVVGSGNELDRQLRKSDFFICVFSVTDETSFENSKKLISYILNFKSREYEEERRRKMETRKSGSHKTLPTPNSDDMISVFTEFTKSKIILVGNGIDQIRKRKITYSKALQCSLQFGVSYFETSSNENINIDDLFAEALLNVDKSLNFIENQSKLTSKLSSKIKNLIKKVDEKVEEKFELLI
eukprot:gene877-9788_t